MTKVRMAVPKDAPALCEMNLVFNGPMIAPSKIAASLRRGAELVAIALSEDLPVAFACAQILETFCYHAPYAEITDVFVRSDYRRKKVATELVAFMENQLSRRGVVHVHILTGVRNRPARSLYEKLGYRSKPKPEILFEKDIDLRRRKSPSTRTGKRNTSV